MYGCVLGYDMRRVDFEPPPPREIIRCPNSQSRRCAHEGLLCPSQYTRPLGAEVHEQMSRSGDQSEARPPVFKSPSKLGILIHLSTHCSTDKKLSRP
ncbi:hypothetical protein TNCV_454531 [Trichonephila clavipes]|nr:hypothetical protein TNCV_454531 [Trichonephila clavipes]